MSVLSLIYSQYSFTSLLHLILSAVGVATIVVLLGAFAGILSYVDVLPTSGGAFGHLTDIRKVGFEFMRWVFFTIALIVFFLYISTGGQWLSGWFAIVIGLWLIDLIANTKVKTDWTYEDFVIRDLRDPRYISSMSKKEAENGAKSVSLALVNIHSLKGKDYSRANFSNLFLSMLGTFGLAFLIVGLNLTIPIIGWALIIYEILVFLVNNAQRDGIFRRYSKGSYQVIKKANGEKEGGYIISFAKDHFLFITKGERKSVFNSSVNEMIDNILNPDVLERIRGPREE